MGVGTTGFGKVGQNIAKAGVGEMGVNLLV